MNVRTALLDLQHVRENPDQTLNLWAVAHEPNKQSREAAHHYGRHLGAVWVIFLKKYERGGGLQRQINDAIFPAVLARDPIALGFTEEIARTVSKAPPWGSVSMAAVPPITYSGSIAKALLQLPWVRVQNGRVNAWAPRVSGDYHQDIATGKHYGACLVDLIRQKGWFHLFAAQPLVPEAHKPIISGMCFTVSEMAVAAPAGATCFQKSAMVLMADKEDPGFGFPSGLPAIPLSASPQTA